MQNTLFSIFTVAAILLLPFSSSAQQGTPPGNASDNSLVVAVRAVPPFAMKDSAGNWEGLSVDLWQDVADKLNLTFSWLEQPFQETLTMLEAGKVDVAVAALTVTEDRERRFDFTHPYYVSGLALGYPIGGQQAWLATLRGFFSMEFLSAIGTLALVLLMAGFAVWLFERRVNKEQFTAGMRGLGDGFWWSAVTMTTVGYGDKAPKTLGGRIVALVWMFASLIIIAGFTASIAASLTTHRLEGELLRERKLSDLTVAVLAESSADAFATNQGARVRRFKTIEEALAAVKAGTSKVVLHDAPILQYHSRNDADWLEVAPAVLVRDDYGFGLKRGSPLREKVNGALLSILRKPVWQNIRRRYLGEQDG